MYVAAHKRSNRTRFITRYTCIEVLIVGFNVPIKEIDRHYLLLSSDTYNLYTPYLLYYPHTNTSDYNDDVPFISNHNNIVYYILCKCVQWAVIYFPSQPFEWPFDIGISVVCIEVFLL